MIWDLDIVHIESNALVLRNFQPAPAGLTQTLFYPVKKNGEESWYLAAPQTDFFKAVDEARRKPFASLRERYMVDLPFRVVVDRIVSILTPTRLRSLDVRQAVVLACYLRDLENFEQSVEAYRAYIDGKDVGQMAVSTVLAEAEYEELEKALAAHRASLVGGFKAATPVPPLPAKEEKPLRPVRGQGDELKVEGDWEPE